LKAELRPTGPFADKRKLKGRAAEGIRFQKRVHQRLTALGKFGDLHEGPWIRYTDTYGVHWCQPDSLVETNDRVLIVEAKLSLMRLDQAKAQLSKLYQPVVEIIFDKPAVLLVAFNNWIRLVDGKEPIETVDNPLALLQRPLRSLKAPLGWHVM